MLKTTELYFKMVLFLLCELYLNVLNVEKNPSCGHKRVQVDMPMIAVSPAITIGLLLFHTPSTPPPLSHHFLLLQTYPFSTRMRCEFTWNN